MSRYKKDFFLLLKKLKNKEHFAFSRYSDGEVFVMQNKKLVLEQKHVIVDDQKFNFGYSSDDYKHFRIRKKIILLVRVVVIAHVLFANTSLG